MNNLNKYTLDQYLENYSNYQIFKPENILVRKEHKSIDNITLELDIRTLKLQRKAREYRDELKELYKNARK